MVHSKKPAVDPRKYILVSLIILIYLNKSNVDHSYILRSVLVIIDRVGYFFINGHIDSRSR